MKTESLDTTTTIDEILDCIVSQEAITEGGWAEYTTDPKEIAYGNPLHNKEELKQALLKWHKSKARSYVPEKPSNELTHMSIAEQHGYEQAIDQTLKAIEESK